MSERDLHACIKRSRELQAIVERIEGLLIVHRHAENELLPHLQREFEHALAALIMAARLQENQG